MKVLQKYPEFWFYSPSVRTNLGIFQKFYIFQHVRCVVDCKLICLLILSNIYSTVGRSTINHRFPIITHTHTGWIKTVIKTQALMKMKIRDRKTNLKIIEKKNIKNKFKWDWLQEKDDHGCFFYLTILGR